MKINYNDLERIYIAAKDCSKGAMEELTCELKIEQNAKTLVVFKNGEVIYQKTNGKVLVPNGLNPIVPLGHAACGTLEPNKTATGKVKDFRWINLKNI
jgi:hypothetical protein